MERTKSEHIKEIMWVKGKADIIVMIEQKRLQRCGHIRGENTKTNYGLVSMGEKEKRTSKKNEGGRSTSSHDNKKFRTRSTEKQRGVAFGFRKTATAVNLLAPELFFLILAHPVYKRNQIR
jgi:hypothetical protein